MKENIFEGAKFGDKFVCRNGMQAVLLSYELITPEPSPTQVNTICLCVEDGYMDSEYNIDGTLSYDNVNEYEIVSRCQEPIDEDKLDELAYANYSDSACFCAEDGFIKGFKVSYRKAKEG